MIDIGETTFQPRLWTNPPAVAIAGMSKKTTQLNCPVRSPKDPSVIRCVTRSSIIAYSSGMRKMTQVGYVTELLQSRGRE